MKQLRIQNVGGAFLPRVQGSRHDCVSSSILKLTAFNEYIHCYWCRLQKCNFPVTPQRSGGGGEQLLEYWSLIMREIISSIKLSISTSHKCYKRKSDTNSVNESSRNVGGGSSGLVQATKGRWFVLAHPTPDSLLKKPLKMLRKTHLAPEFELCCHGMEYPYLQWN